MICTGTDSGLQFQEIHLVSLPARSDKQDAHIVQAALTGFKIKISDGVDGTQVSNKALPLGMESVKPNIIGCWRAHLDVLRNMVANRIESALIMEDDIDWDVSLKAQMLEFARGVRYVIGTGPDDTPHSPYGDGWDMLWIGHCAAQESAENKRRWVIPLDPTVLPLHKRTGGITKPNMTSWDDNTRIVFESNNGCCTASYAMSLRGAEKALYHFSMLPYGGPLDWGFNDACRDKKSGFRCISPFPQITGTYRPAGNTSKDSDIETGDGSITEKGYTQGLMFSARQNMDRLLTGQTTFMSEYPEWTGEEMTLEDIGSARGHPEEVSW